MRDEIVIGPTPADEDCISTGIEDYAKKSKIECRVYLEQLERAFKDVEKHGAYFRIKGSPHEFGTYYEVSVVYDEDDELQVDFAYKVENDAPMKWDAQSKKDLKERFEHAGYDYEESLKEKLVPRM